MKSIVYEPTTVDIKAVNLINNFKPELLKNKANIEAYKDYPVPIFILGMPRSGTSLAEQILASHPDVYGAGEIYALPATMAMTEDSTTSIYECFQRFAAMTSEQLTECGLQYLEEIKALSQGNYKYVSDKLPSNFWALPLIKAILPQAIIIHTVRNPVDTCLSCYQQNFSSGQNFSFSLEGLGHFYNAYADVMKLWQQYYSFYELSYEEVTANQEAETRKLLEYCGLSWDNKCLSFHETKRSVATASTMQVREPIYRRSVEKWRNYEQYLGTLLDILNT